jgi:hypothetical protein
MALCVRIEPYFMSPLGHFRGNQMICRCFANPGVKRAFRQTFHFKHCIYSRGAEHHRTRRRMQTINGLLHKTSCGLWYGGIHGFEVGIEFQYFATILGS